MAEETSKPILRSDSRETFRTLLEGVASKPELGTLMNRFPWQSRLATERLLQYARSTQKPIRILSGSAPEGFYDQAMVKELEACKAAGCTIQILIWQKDATGISDGLMNLFETDTIDLLVSGTDEAYEKVPHFLLVGDSAFRQEAPHKRFESGILFSENSPEVPARIDFDDPVTGKKLRDLFDGVWNPS